MQCVKSEENRENIGFPTQCVTQCVVNEENNAVQKEESSFEQPDNTTQCVNDKPTWKIGVCKHCGNTFEKRTTWQLFCKEQCRLDFHGVTSIAQLYKKRKNP
jgi:hypothetical protein